MAEAQRLEEGGETQKGPQTATEGKMIFACGVADYRANSRKRTTGWEKGDRTVPYALLVQAHEVP